VRGWAGFAAVAVTSHLVVLAAGVVAGVEQRVAVVRELAGVAGVDRVDAAVGLETAAVGAAAVASAAATVADSMVAEVGEWEGTVGAAGAKADLAVLLAAGRATFGW